MRGGDCGRRVRWGRGSVNRRIVEEGWFYGNRVEVSIDGLWKNCGGGLWK